MKKPKIQVVVGLIIIFFLSIVLAAQVREAKESNLSIFPALSNEQYSSKSEEAEFVFEEKYTNSEYGFSFEYPREWSIDTENIDFTLDESLGAEELIYLQTDAREGLVYGNSLSIVVTNLSFSDIADNIEESERLPSGETLTEFYDIERIAFDNVIAKYGLHGTAIGIPTEFYYIPLYKNKGLYIHAPHQELTTDEIRQIVSTIEVTPDFSQTYVDPYGYSFQYPYGWEISSITNRSVVLEKKHVESSDDSSYIRIELQNNAAGKSIEEYYSTYLGHGDTAINLYENNNSRLTQLGSLEAVEFISVPGPVESTITVAEYDGMFLEVWREREDSIQAYELLRESFLITGNIVPASWPRHSFKELGFSIQLPFTAESIESNSIECGPESICDTLGYKFTASLKDSNNYFLTAISDGWSPPRDRQPGEMPGYIQEGDRYFEKTNFINYTELFPLQFVYVGGLDVLIYDSADSGRFAYIPRHSAVQGKKYTALIPVENTDRYEMAVLQLNVEELSYDDFVLAVQSIQKNSDSVETVAVGETLRVDKEILSDRQLLWLRDEYMNDLISVEYTDVPDYERTFYGGVEIASNESAISVKRTAVELQGYLLYAPATGQRAEFVGTMGEFNTPGEYFATCNVSALSGYSASVYETSTLEQVYELSSIDLSRIKSYEVNDDIFTIDYLDIDKQEKQSMVELKAATFFEGVSADAIDIPSDWLTYENEEYGFSFEHPSNLPFLFKSDTDYFVLELPVTEKTSSKLIGFQIVTKNSEQNLHEWLEDNVNVSNKFTFTSEVNSNGIEFISRSGASSIEDVENYSGQDFFEDPTGENVFIVSYLQDKTLLSENNYSMELLNQIIDTVSF